MKCPVCYTNLPKEIWTKYADKKTIQRFEAFNKPFRPFSRFCGNCGEEVCVSKAPVNSAEEEKRLASQIIDLVRSLTGCEGELFGIINDELNLVMSKKKTVFELYQFCAQKLDNYCAAMDSTEIRTEKKRKMKEINNEVMGAILAKMIGFEKDADKWRQLQHLHVKRFPKLKCENCTAQMCFQCGESTWHLDETCHEHMLKKLTASRGTDLFETIQWTLTHSKRCPNCSILIYRDDGCNKVDCLHCGYNFCWVCEDLWSAKCGFFKCATKLAKEEETQSSSPSPEKIANEPSSPNKRRRQHEEAHTEIGVPNVIQIERKLSTILQDRAIFRSEPNPPNSNPSAGATLQATARNPPVSERSVSNSSSSSSSSTISSPSLSPSPSPSPSPPSPSPSSPLSSSLPLRSVSPPTITTAPNIITTDIPNGITASIAADMASTSINVVARKRFVKDWLLSSRRYY